MSSHADPHARRPGQPLVGHLVPPKVLIAVFVALLVLTGATYWVTFIDLGPLNLWIAMVIAFVKATLVVMYFMHLKYDRMFNIVFFVGSLAFIALFIGLAMTDTAAYKGNLIPPTAKDYAPEITRMRAQTP